MDNQKAASILSMKFERLKKTDWWLSMDNKDYESIISLFKKNEAVKASNKIMGLDTIIRDTIPNNVYNYAYKILEG